MVSEAKCFPFAKYTTKRTKFSLPPDIVVDMDEAQYGYSLVEVEVLCSSHAQIPAAKERYEWVTVYGTNVYLHPVMKVLSLNDTVA